MTADILDLIEGVQDGDLEAARKLADIVAEAVRWPDRSVADAFRIEVVSDRRNRIIRDLAGEGSLRQRAQAIRQRAQRYRAHPADRVTAGERGLLWQLHQMGSLDLSERQIRRILGGR